MESAKFYCKNDVDPDDLYDLQQDNYNRGYYGRNRFNMEVFISTAEKEYYFPKECDDYSLPFNPVVLVFHINEDELEENQEAFESLKEDYLEEWTECVSKKEADEYVYKWLNE